MVASMKIAFVLDVADLDLMANFWCKALGYREVAEARDDHWVVLVPAARDGGSGGALTLQRVPEPKVVKNRMHFDLWVKDRDAEVERLVALGASILRPVTAAEPWVVMADPEGNEFCVDQEVTATSDE
jgi:predicted enzyme related to lactoylglutathione lyase